jgi:hypothetical protein
LQALPEWLRWLVLFAVCAAGCSTERMIYEAALPGTGTHASLKWLGEHGGYVGVHVETAGVPLRFFVARADPGCAALRTDLDPIEYENNGPLGRLRSGEITCDLVGILSLREWRSRQRRRSPGLLPRATASWSEIYRDEEMVLARGRFPLSNRLGWAGGADTVAVFAPGAVCDPVLERGVGTLVFYDGGPNVLALLADGAVCPVLGLAIPLDPGG